MVLIVIDLFKDLQYFSLDYIPKLKYEIASVETEGIEPSS